MKAIGYEYLSSKHDSCPPGWATDTRRRTYPPVIPSPGAATIAFSSDLPEPFSPSPMPYGPRVSLIYS